jgi:hypothetical protein
VAEKNICGNKIELWNKNGKADGQGKFDYLPVRDINL